jgi:hypothetical protein
MVRQPKLACKTCGYRPAAIGQRLRGAVASASGYYANKAEAIRAVDSRLAADGLTIEAADLPGDEGRATAEIVDTDGAHVGHVALAWYRMPVSGRWEFTIYVS